MQLNNNASSYPNAAFQGIILAPNNAVSIVNANLNGRVFGGDSQDMQIVSGTTILPNVSAFAVPESNTLLSLRIGLIGIGLLRRSAAKSR